jgi:hypothetical protein
MVEKLEFYSGLRVGGTSGEGTRTGTEPGIQCEPRGRLDDAVPFGLLFAA